MSPSRRRALLLLTAAAIVVPLAGSCAVARALAHPARATLGAPPPDLHADVVGIRSGSGAALAAWLVRGEPGRGAVLLLHPLRGNRTTMLDRARFLRRAGYTVLLVDLQAHGESPGDRLTFGARESVDARAALGYLRAAAPRERVGALGVSLGGASLLLGAGALPANTADAVILEAVYPTIEEAVADRLRIWLGPLGPALTPLLTSQLRPQLGIRPAELRPIDRIGGLRVPLLVIAGAVDRHTTLAESRRLVAAAPAPKEIWVVEAAAHVDLLTFAGSEYERRVLAFFERHLRPRG